MRKKWNGELCELEIAVLSERQSLITTFQRLPSHPRLQPFILQAVFFFSITVPISWHLPLSSKLLTLA